MKYAFIALHRLQFSVRTMCRLLRVHPSGFYTWLKNPLSTRASEDKRQTDLLLKAREESGKVYGYRKLHDDLLDQEKCAVSANQCEDWITPIVKRKFDIIFNQQRLRNEPVLP